MKLDEKLVSLRKEKGLTQMEAAEELHVSRQAISRWESGVAVPSTENLRFLGELYGVSIDYLINEELERPVQVEAANGENRKHKNWAAWLLCILIVVVIAAAIGVIAAKREPEKVDFSEVESEDWNDVSTDEIPIEW